MILNIVMLEPLLMSTMCQFFWVKLLITFSIPMYIMCELILCVFSALSRRVGALQIVIIIIMIRAVNLETFPTERDYVSRPLDQQKHFNGSWKEPCMSTVSCNWSNDLPADVQVLGVVAVLGHVKYHPVILKQSPYPNNLNSDQQRRDSTVREIFTAPPPPQLPLSPPRLQMELVIEP